MYKNIRLLYIFYCNRFFISLYLRYGTNVKLLVKKMSEVFFSIIEINVL